MTYPCGESKCDIYCKRIPSGKLLRRATDAKPSRKRLNCTLTLSCDIGMPILNGLEAAQQISKTSPVSRIVFLTQNADRELMSAALNTGAKGYVLKANAATELLPVIAAALPETKSSLSAGMISRSLVLGSGLVPEPPQFGRIRHKL